MSDENQTDKPNNSNGMFIDVLKIIAHKLKDPVGLTAISLFILATVSQFGRVSDEPFWAAAAVVALMVFVRIFEINNKFKLDRVKLDAKNAIELERAKFLLMSKVTSGRNQKNPKASDNS